jgi:hypothetical protein
MTAAVTLWALGAVCLITAIVSAEAWFAGARLPAPKTRGQRAGVAGVGAALLFLGFIAFFAQKGSSPPANVSASGSSAAVTPTGSQTPSVGSTPPPGPTSTGSVAFKGPVGITFSGIDFDSNPPGSGPAYINWQRYNYRLQGYGSVIVSRYPSSGALPTEAACRSWAMTHNSQILDGVNRGDRLCFITQDGRTVRFIVTNISSDAVEGQATVWSDSNQ